MSEDYSRLGDVISLQRGFDLPAQNRRPGSFIVMGGGGPNGVHAEARSDAPGVIVGRSGSGFGSAFLVRESFWPHNTCMFVTDFKGNYPYYVYYLLDSVDFTTYNTGGAQPSLNRNFIYPIKVFKPPFPEQRKIAEILGACDEAIESQELLLAQQKEQKKGLMQQLLTGKTRFKEFDGKPWREVHLGDVFNERKEVKRDDLELLAVTGSGGVVKRDGLNRKDTSSEDKSKYKRVCPGDIAYNTMRMWQGVSGLSKYEGIVSPAYTIVQPTKEMDPVFSAYFFKLPQVVSLFHRYSQGLVRDTLNLKYPNFKVIKVTIPEREEQERIGQVLLACDQEITLQQQKLEQLKQQKKGLMQQLLTGKVRVNL